MGAVGVELLVEDQCTFVTRTHDGLLPLLNLPLFFLFLPSTPVPVNSSLHEPVWTGAASFFFVAVVAERTPMIRRVVGAGKDI